MGVKIDFLPLMIYRPWFRATTRSKILINRTLASPHVRVHHRRRKISRDETFHTSKDARETMISFFVGEGSIIFFLKVQYRFLYFFFQIDTCFPLLETTLFFFFILSWFLKRFFKRPIIAGINIELTVNCELQARLLSSDYVWPIFLDKDRIIRKNRRISVDWRMIDEGPRRQSTAYVIFIIRGRVANS